MHGANRLASNSLLEGLVFSRRIAQLLEAEGLPPRRRPAADPRAPGLVDAAVLPALRATMTENAGVLRTADGLAAAADRLSSLADEPGDGPATESWEATNLLTVARSLVEAASLRRETRGSHWREDFPDRDDDHWHGHVDVRLDAAGRVRTAFHPTDCAHAPDEPLDLRSEQ